MILPISTPLPSPQLIAIVQKITPEEKKPEPIHYTFIEGDVLEHIATSQNTTVQRLFDKNPAIANPDDIKTGETIEIPSAEEPLTHRDMPASQLWKPIITSLPNNTNSGGFFNTYTIGQCTWYVASQRQVPSNWGNASDWLYNAQAQGWSTGSEPRVGAIAWARNYGHVAIVRSVNPDGTISIQEMNFRGVNGGGEGIVSSRVAPISEFSYIY